MLEFLVYRNNNKIYYKLYVYNEKGEVMYTLLGGRYCYFKMIGYRKIKEIIKHCYFTQVVLGLCKDNKNEVIRKIKIDSKKLTYLPTKWKGSFRDVAYFIVNHL